MSRPSVEVNGGRVTSWLPMTTAPPAAPACSTVIYEAGTMLLAYDPYLGLSIDPRMICLPPEATLWWEQSYQASVSSTTIATTISLGPIVCPDGYVTAETSTLDATSTLVACCPNEYKFQSLLNFGQGGECISTISKGGILSFYTFVSNTWTMTGVSLPTTLTRTFLATGIPVNGFVFAEATTASATTSHASQTLSSITATNSAVNSIPSVSSDPATNFVTMTANPSTSAVPPSNSSLSTGSKIGIGLGVGVGVIGICCLCVAVLLLRRSKSIKYAPGSKPDRVEDTPYEAAVQETPPSPAKEEIKTARELAAPHNEPVRYELGIEPTGGAVSLHA
ncbi:hypothetical protein BP6252_01122 [Coleophoma cylindrospora]|uniref:Mid2 domain-containing protein n=1 Tax=Coleophoma cylindrospora TaxID=1849047 RepID=A0A3D8SRZ1_9HELO|nr:hypothetical protein BP6252_01122 [Coleophoma cylindrospora]